MWLYIFIGIAISTVAYLILLFLQGAKVQDERNNHAEMYRILLKLSNETHLIDIEMEVLGEYENRFML